MGSGHGESQVSNSFTTIARVLAAHNASAKSTDWHMLEFYACCEATQDERTTNICQIRVVNSLQAVFPLVYEWPACPL